MKTIRILSFVSASFALAFAIGIPAANPAPPDQPTGSAPAASSESHPEHLVIKPADIQWGAAPPSLPAGAQAAVLEGDPAKPGPFTVRFKAPAGYKVPPHTHPATERLTVISGSMNLGAGSTFDTSKGKKMSAGSFSLMPANMQHFVWLDEETVIQINGVGPWEINYVNPADDPRLKK